MTRSDLAVSAVDPKDVQQALRLWNHRASRESPLVHLQLVRTTMAETGWNSRRATNHILEKALQILQQSEEMHAQLLRMRFVHGHTMYRTASAFSIAESTAWRWQQTAIFSLSRVLSQLEQQKLAERMAILECRLEPNSYVDLIGVEVHLADLTRVINQPGPPFLILLEGMGGIGKTSLADRLMRQFIRDASGWDLGWTSAKQNWLILDGSTRTTTYPAITVDELIETLVRQLMPDMPVTPSSEQSKSALQDRIKRTPHLMVIDNLETVDDVKSLLPVLRDLADPSKFILTSRESLYGEPDVFHFPVPELGPDNAYRLIRQEAQIQNLADLVECSDEELEPIYEVVGGNPLALRLVIGQAHVQGLDSIIDDLIEARANMASNLYSYIYWRVWMNLNEMARHLLLAMPLVPEGGAGKDYLARISDLDDNALASALRTLVSHSLVDVRGDVHRRKYSIHNLTRTFLLNHVIQWFS